RGLRARSTCARVDLPATLRSNPTYRKMNPADAPVIILALTSKTRTPGQIYDAVSNIVSQRCASADTARSRGLKHRERARRAGPGRRGRRDRRRLAAGGARGAAAA